MQADDQYIPIEVRLNYGDWVTSTSPHKQAQAQKLLQQYPELARPAKTNQLPLSRVPIDISELAFETTQLEPVLKRAGVRYQRQFITPIQVGRSLYQARIDFYLHDEQGILSIIESKKAIMTSEELAQAIVQAKSYALPLGAPSFLIAAPQHIWLFSLHRNCETLEKEYTLATFKRNASQLRTHLLAYR